MRRLPLVLLVTLAVGIAALGLIDLQGDVRYAEAPGVSGELTPSTSDEVPHPAHASSDPAPSAADPPEVAEELALPQEVSGDGPLPRVQSPAEDPPAIPRIALVVTELGLAQDLTADALRLPAETALAFSPYPERTAAWQDLARRQGHEALLGLPLAPSDPARADVGPLALSPAMPTEVLRERLARILAQGSSYIALAGAAGAFTEVPAAFSPVAEELARRGLAFIELGGDELAATAQATSLAYRTALGPVDQVPLPEEIDRRLAAAEDEARRTGSAVVFARPFALGYERLGLWAERLPGKGIALVPLSALLNPPGN